MTHEFVRRLVWTDRHRDRNMGQANEAGARNVAAVVVGRRAHMEYDELRVIEVRRKPFRGDQHFRVFGETAHSD